MKYSLPDFRRTYEAALCTQLDQGIRLDPMLIEKISGKVRTSGMPVLDFAKVHERIVVERLLLRCPTAKRSSLVRNAGNFFAAVVLAVGAGSEGDRDAALLKKSIESLSTRTVELASANQMLSAEVIERKKAEIGLKKSEQQLTAALEKSERLTAQLRSFSRQILSFQEEERKKISRELHDVVAQALLGTNIRLATLKKESGLNAQGLARNISQTQKMITKSADIVYQFARELRPPALDDLGLIPALQGYMKNFTSRTGVLTHLAIFPGVERISATKRTVLYRVAQEALTNVSRHADASRVTVTIQRDAKLLLMEICDDGKAFKADQVFISSNPKRLGLLGMRERIEMVGGRFEIESAPGKGTKIMVRIPVSKATEKRWQAESPTTPSAK